MDKNEINKIIQENVFPDLEEFLGAEESSLFLYIHYNDEEHVSSTMIPSPGEKSVKPAMKMLAKEIYKEMDNLPSIIIAVEKVKYLEVDSDKPTLKSIEKFSNGIVFVALDVMETEGMAFLYSSDDMKEVSAKDYDPRSDDGPPVLNMALLSFVRECLVLGELVEEEEDDGKEDTPHISFSRN